MTWTMTREDGPNTTAANKSVSYVGTDSNMTMNTQDELFQGTPSRVVKDMQVNVGEADVAKTPEYIKKGIEGELKDLTSSGRQQLVTPVNDEIQSTAYSQLANEVGADYKEVDGQGVFTPGTKPSSVTMDVSFKAADAIKGGYSEDEVKAFLAEQGYDNAQLETVFNRSNQIVAARDGGYTDEEIKGYLTSTETKVQNVDTAIPTYEDDPQETEWVATQWGAVERPKQTAYDRISSDEQMSAEDLLANLKVLAPNMSSMTTRTAGFFGNQEAAAKASKTLDASRAKIVQLASERGLELEWSNDLGQFLASTPEGQVVVDEGFWNSVKSEGFEIGGAVSGAIAGARLGAVGGPWGALGGSIVGAAAGSAVGSQLDYLSSAVALQEDLEGRVMAHKALTAAEMSVVGDVLGFGLFKGSGAVYKGIARVKDFVADGNTKGALSALKEMMFIDDKQAQELVTQLSRVTNAPVPGAKTEAQQIAATVVTQPGAEHLVRAVAAFDPQASRAVNKAIDTRAKDVLKATNELSGDNIGRIFQEDVANYVADVKNFYGATKAVAAQSPRNANFRFDFDKLAIQPVIDTLQKNISDPDVLAKFTLQAGRVRDMSDSRTFGDLLELRQVVNEFKFNKRITKQKDFKALNDVIDNIDIAIENGAHFVLEKPNKWLGDYATARKQYAKMKQLERNVMFKAMTRKGIDEKDMVRSMSKYITAIDGTFNDLMSQLPRQMKGKVENAVIDTLANKYTAGVGEGMRATNFPMLANDLEQVVFTTPQARQMKSALMELSEVFRNDVPLAQVSGNIQIPQFQSYLTADPVVRAKFEIASSMFNYVKTLVPNKQQNTLALVRKTAAVLENPLNSKSVKELMKETAGEVDLSPQILKMQQEAARAKAAGKDVGAAKVKLYGNGSVLSTSKAAGAEQTIPMHRIASAEDARIVAESQGIDFTDKKLLDKVLASNGYKAVQQGSDRVRVLK